MTISRRATRLSCLSAWLVWISFVAPANAVDVYVSPSGNDANPGTAEEPFATLECARDAVRQRKKTGTVDDGVTVRLVGGTYLISESFVLNAEDSGTQDGPIVYRAAGDTPSRLCGGRLPDASAFHRVTDRDTRARIPPEGRGSVLQLDLQELHIRHGKRFSDKFVDSGGIVDLYFQGRRMPLARFPNASTMSMKRVLRNTGASPDEGGTFEYREAYAARHKHWQTVLDRGVWLKGYWRVPWQIEAVRVKSIDTDQHTVTFAQSVPGGIGSKYHRPEGSGDEPYWALNLLEELDQPGEWCVDFEAQKLYFWPPDVLTAGSVLIGDMETPLIALDDVSHLSIEGLILEGGLGNAVEIRGGEANQVARCTVRNFGRSAVIVTGGRNHNVTGCEIHNLGGSGVLLYGGDRRKLVPAQHSVVSNHIHHYGQVQRVYAAGVNVGCRGTGRDTAAVGMRVAHNCIHDAPHVGVLYGGNDHVLEYNEVYRVCLVSNDMGGFYTVGDWTSRGNIVRWNLVHNSPNAHGIYCDDGDSGDRIYGNVLYGLDAGVFIGGGHDNDVTGNVIVDCQRGIHIDARGVTRGYNLDNRRMVGAVNSVNHQMTPWSQRYPAMTRILDFHPELPTGTRFASNVILQCRRDMERSASEGELRFTELGRNLELHSAATLEGVTQLKAFIEEQQSTWETLPEFKPIPMEKIGLLPRSIRK